MATYRICKAFTVESGHMLSKHPEACRYPHGHSRRIEMVVSTHQLDKNDMVLDFKALKLMAAPIVNKFDHAMALNSSDPLRKAIEETYPDGVRVFEGEDPTTEVLARHLFEEINAGLRQGFTSGPYSIPASSCTLERVRVWETDSSWAEYSDQN